ncbi:MAG: alanine--glyoxylate aminotransferase family protein [Chloroflexi bacterium]|nr:alanine--glyoxylate aminotransferase family protein [Chloroflexota bacterium]
MARLFVPGPVDVAPEVAQAQTKPMLPHRSPEFEALFHACEQRARALFFTQYRVFISASSGTGFQEAAVRNLVRPGRRALVGINGAFGKRWREVAETNGILVDSIEVPWGRPLRGKLFTAALEARDDYDLVMVVHNETSTGVENPIAEIAAAVRAVRPDALIAVDSVSGLAGARLEMDAWGLDMVFTSGQKALALPPGIALAAVSDRALARAEEVPQRGWYFDLLRLEKHRLKDSTPATPPVSLIYALDVQLDRILAEGLEARFARHAALAQRVQTWARERGFGLFAAEGYRSKTVTTITNTHGLDIAALNAFLLQRGMRIANGYGPLKGETFRIAHMGEIQMSDLDQLLAALDEYLHTS